MNTTIQAVTQAGTTISPSAATPRPAISEAASSWVPGSSDGKQIERKRQPGGRAHRDFADQQPLRHQPSRPADAGDRLGPGELHRAEVERRDRHRPAEQQPAWRRGGQVDRPAPAAAAMLAKAKKGARCAREISWTSRSGEFSGSAPRAASPADSPPGRRAETSRLYRSGALYMVPTRQLISQCPIQRELMPG